MAKKTRQLYMDVAATANVPLDKRKKVAIGRGGERRILRRYHLLPDEQVRLLREMQEKNKFISPYGAARLYTYIIDALSTLGAGKSHKVSAVYAKFRELASNESTKNAEGKTLWDRFYNKPVRNETTGREALGRFIQNVEVIQRLGGDHPYGFKLAQVGACIDVLVDGKGEILLQLRTNIIQGDPVKPINMNRKRQYTKTVDEVASKVVIPVEGDSEGEGHSVESSESL